MVLQLEMPAHRKETEDKPSCCRSVKDVNILTSKGKGW